MLGEMVPIEADGMLPRRRVLWSCGVDGAENSEVARPDVDDSAVLYETLPFGEPNPQVVGDGTSCGDMISWNISSSMSSSLRLWVSEEEGVGAACWASSYVAVLASAWKSMNVYSPCSGVLDLQSVVGTMASKSIEVAAA